MLKLHHINKSFSGMSQPVLNNLSFTLRPHEFCVLIGSNGCGKSTLLKSIAGEIAIDSGTIELPHRNRVATVNQDPRLGTIPELSILENVVLSLLRNKSAGLRFYRHYESMAIQLIRELGLGLENRLHEKMQHLSGGQRQVIATLMAIHAKPKILLLDEHTSALDPIMQKRLMHYTAQSIHREKISCIMISHHLHDAIHYGDRLIMLHQGSIVLDVTGSEKQQLTVNDLLKQSEEQACRIA